VVVVRKPAGTSWESFVDRQIREAQERGAFDDLPGAGKPIADLGQPYDELWWIKRKLKREGVSVTPPTIAIRRAVEEAREQAMAARSEDEVREIVAAVNARVREVNRTATKGPASSVMPLDVERVVDDWRSRR
jgi:hypothetical protein